MKAVILLAVLTVFVILPEGGDASWWRDTWRKVKTKAKEKLREWWQRVKRRREVRDLDIDQDGSLDLSELEAVFGERHARDVWDLMEAGDKMTLEQFERDVRELDELEEDE